MTPEEESYVLQLENQINDNKKLSPNTETAMVNSLYSQSQDQNLIVFQLELDSILEKLEHLLSGDIIKVEGENIIYAKSKNKDERPFNDFGVKAIMNTLSFYLNRNTILSYYQEDRINEILTDLGEELSDFILCNYVKMGLDTDAKKSRYPLIVINILNTIESAYNRSLRGNESNNLKTARIVTQNETGGMSHIIGGFGGSQNNSKKRFNLFKPSTWA